MTDKELLELAAKAAGYKLVQGNGTPQERDLYIELYDAAGFASYPHWNPFEKDDDALRLAVKLKLTITQDGDWCDVIYNTDKTRCVATYLYKNADNDPYAATRRAIVRAAAEIGKTL